MAQDVSRHLDRARRYLEKNKLRDAVAEYQAVLEQRPSHQEAVQALADLYVRLDEPLRAAHYYGMQFDRLVEAGDTAKAAAIFIRFLKPIPQPPERLAQFAFLLQRQNKINEAIEQYAAAAERFREKRNSAQAFDCLEKIAQLDPENPARQIEMGELADSLGKKKEASRAFLRAGQLVLAAGEIERSIEYLGRARDLAPEERSPSLLLASARLRTGDAAAAVALLEPFTADETDSEFLSVFGEALLRMGQLDRARPVLEAFYRQKQDNFAGLFLLTDAYLKVGEEDKGLAVLRGIKEWMFGLRRESEFATQVDGIAAAYPASVRLAEFWSALYEELNREAKYFDALIRLFDLYLEAGRLPEACNALDRLVEIDPYDYRNHERIAKLEGKADPAYLRSIQSRAMQSAATISRAQALRDESAAGAAEAAGHVDEATRARQALEDLTVQVEIFLQYSLRPKAIERLQRIAEMFPGEEETNERLRALYERAEWWPKGAPSPAKDARPAAGPTPMGGYSAEMHRDLAAIAEITRLLYRQTTPREVVAAAANEIGKYLGAARCFAAIGKTGETGQLSAAYARPGLPPAGEAAISGALTHVTRSQPDAQGGVELRPAGTPALSESGLAAALGVQLTDKETQTLVGALLVGDTAPRVWKPNESFFLQAVGDQLVISVNHTRLRSLVRTLAVADEKTGLLSRGAYLDCLLAETARARSQNAPLALVILQLDRGHELLRQHGEAALEQYLEELAHHIEPVVRQSDLAVKYTAWSLAFILPDTALDKAGAFAEKLRAVAAQVQPKWTAAPLTLSAVVAEAAGRAGDDKEDIVSEWINRAEFGLDEARHRGGNTILSLVTPAR